MGRALLSLDNLIFRYPSADEHPGTLVHDGLSFSVAEGGLTVVLGAADAGKTTLGRIIAGLIPRFTGGRLEGSVRLGDRDLGASMPYEIMDEVGLVSQDSDEQVFTTRCDTEVAFALESMGIPRVEMRERVAASLRAMGLAGFEGRNPATLSGGEKKRLLLSCLDAIGPRLWILDESLGELDTEWKVRVLDAVSGRGRTALVMDSRWSRLLEERGTAFGVLATGRIAAAADRVDDAGLTAALGDAGLLPRRARRRGSVADGARRRIRVESLSFRFGDTSEFALRVDSLELAQGEVCALVGRNGSGKSTLGRILCGLLVPETGTVSIGEDGRLRSATPDERCRSVGYLFQNPDHQIYLPTVGEELALGLTRQGATRMETERRIAEAVALFGLPSLDTPPALMSYGARRRLQAATYYLLCRDFLVLDEVDSGLSYREVETLLDALEEGRPGILLITHDMALARSVSDRVVTMDQGRIVAELRRDDFGRLP